MYTYIYINVYIFIYIYTYSYIHKLETTRLLSQALRSRRDALDISVGSTKVCTPKMIVLDPERFVLNWF